MERVAKRTQFERQGLQHFANGSRGYFEWMFRGVDPNGRELRCFGCDLFAVRGGKTRTKMIFLKPERRSANLNGIISNR